MPAPKNCPCDSAFPYELCCGMYHGNPGTAPTAEALMRSRYSAFALKNFAYINATQKLSAETMQSVDDIAQSNEYTQWLKLEVINTEQGLNNDTRGVVEFCAHFKEGKHTGRLSERSLFEKTDGCWYYVAGEHEVQGNTPLKKSALMNLGRNDPCFCDSGKKFKKCCG